jgi:uncharacterized protein
MSRTTYRALRLTVYVDQSDQWGHTPLAHEIARRAKEAGLAGASAFQGVEGFGTHEDLHTSHVLSLSTDLPVAVVIIDEPARVRAFLPALDELVGEGLVTLDEVEAIPYGRGGGARDA